MGKLSTCISVVKRTISHLTISFVLVTASHLPEDKNGFKFFGKSGGLTKSDIDDLIVLAQAEAKVWYDMGIVPPASGKAGVLCSELVSLLR